MPLIQSGLNKYINIFDITKVVGIIFSKEISYPYPKIIAL